MAEPVPTSDTGSPTQKSASGDPSPDRNVGKDSPDAQGRGAEGSAARGEGVAGPERRSIADYVGRLSEEHKMLVALKAQLYGGSWEPMLDDLRNRLAGKPYIFKLVHRIQDDIGRIEEMQKFEAEHKIDLIKYVDG